MIIIFIIHHLLDYLYRPYIYANSTFDFYLADSFSNFTSVIGLSALALYKKGEALYKSKYSEISLVIMPAISMIIYEFIQLLIPWNTFSFIDIIYSLLGGVLVFIIKKTLYDKWILLNPKQ